MGETVSNAEIVVPKSEALKQLQERLGKLVNQAQSIVVKDQVSYALAAGVRTSFKSYLEAVKFQTGPEIAQTKERLERLKQEEAIFLNPGKDGLAQLETKMTEFREEEKRQAKAEQDRKNAELAREARERAVREREEAEKRVAENKAKAIAEINRLVKSGAMGKREAAKRLKAVGAAAEADLQDAAAAEEEAKNAPPTVTVKPNVPAVAGAPKNQTFYYAELQDKNLIIAAYLLAVKQQNFERAAFLEKFLTIDEGELGRFARKTQDNEKAAEAVPGVRFWSKG